MDKNTAARILGGISPRASTAAVRRAYRQAAKTVHPDAGGSHEAFVALGKAQDAMLAPAPAPTPAPAAVNQPNWIGWSLQAGACGLSKLADLLADVAHGCATKADIDAGIDHAREAWRYQRINNHSVNWDDVADALEDAYWAA